MAFFKKCTFLKPYILYTYVTCFQNIINRLDNIIKTFFTFLFRRITPFVLRTDGGVHTDPCDIMVRIPLEQFSRHQMHPMFVAIVIPMAVLIHFYTHDNTIAELDVSFWSKNT